MVEWLKKQNLYTQHMIMSTILLSSFSMLALIVLWDSFLPLEEIFLRKIIFRLGLSFLLVLFLAERITVKMIEPLQTLVVKTTEKSMKKLGIKMAVGSSSEIRKLGMICATLLGKLESVCRDRNEIVADVRRKKKMRDRLIRKLICVQEDERRRISRELHDEIGQAVTTLMVSMRALADGAADIRQREILMGARDLAAATLNDIRVLAVDLRPPVLDDLGLIPAIKKYIAKFFELHNVRVEFSHRGGEGLVNGSTAMALYRIIQESLTNVIKHSGADQIWITIEIHDKHVFLSILDNGMGFLAEVIYERRRENRLGVYGMMERVQLLGGTFTIDSEPGRGTKITVIVPNVGGE